MAGNKIEGKGQQLFDNIKKSIDAILTRDNSDLYDLFKVDKESLNYINPHDSVMYMTKEERKKCAAVYDTVFKDIMEHQKNILGDKYNEKVFFEQFSLKNLNSYTSNIVEMFDEDLGIYTKPVIMEREKNDGSAEYEEKKYSLEQAQREFGKSAHNKDKESLNNLRTNIGMDYVKPVSNIKDDSTIDSLAEELNAEKLDEVADDTDAVYMTDEEYIDLYKTAIIRNMLVGDRVELTFTPFIVDEKDKVKDSGKSISIAAKSFDNEIRATDAEIEKNWFIDSITKRTHLLTDEVNKLRINSSKEKENFFTVEERENAKLKEAGITFDSLYETLKNDNNFKLAGFFVTLEGEDKPRNIQEEVNKAMGLKPGSKNYTSVLNTKTLIIKALSNPNNKVTYELNGISTGLESGVQREARLAKETEENRIIKER